MFARNRLMLMGSIAVTCVMLPACIERNEKIRVHRDGRVDMELSFKGDPSDFRSGDTLPGPGGVWNASPCLRWKSATRRLPAQALREGAQGVPYDQRAQARGPSVDVEFGIEFGDLNEPGARLAPGGTRRR